MFPLIKKVAPIVTMYDQETDYKNTGDLMKDLRLKYYIKNESLLDSDFQKYLTFDEKLQEF